MAFGLDGYAHAAEALAGHAYGAGDAKRLRKVTRYSAIWAGGSAIALGLVFLGGGNHFVALITDIDSVRSQAEAFLPWMAALPLLSVFAFLFDGIYIGATRVVELRNSMFAACLAYLAALFLTLDAFGNHALWFAMCVFMTARSILLALWYPRLERMAAENSADRQ